MLLQFVSLIGRVLGEFFLPCRQDLCHRIPGRVGSDTVAVGAVANGLPRPVAPGQSVLSTVDPTGRVGFCGRCPDSVGPANSDTSSTPNSTSPGARRVLIPSLRRHVRAWKSDEPAPPGLAVVRELPYSSATYLHVHISPGAGSQPGCGTSPVRPPLLGCLLQFWNHVLADVLGLQRLAVQRLGPLRRDPDGTGVGFWILAKFILGRGGRCDWWMPCNRLTGSNLGHARCP